MQCFCVLQYYRSWLPGRSFLAVNSLSLGISQNECFGLLGVNGAGKTTSFKMLTGEHLVSSGRGYIGSRSITGNMLKVCLGVVSMRYMILPLHTIVRNK